MLPANIPSYHAIACGREPQGSYHRCASLLLSALAPLAASNDAQGIADSGAMQFGSDVDRHSLIVDDLQTEDKCNPEVLSFVVHRLGPLHRQRERVRQLGLARP